MALLFLLKSYEMRTVLYLKQKSIRYKKQYITYKCYALLALTFAFHLIKVANESISHEIVFSTSHCKIFY